MRLGRGILGPREMPVFKVDRVQNRLERLEEKKFASLNVRERAHVQEWLANMPSALGEELLVIQKEFDGFDETRERLDLLAIDKDGNLVLIENKLDDTGRDVVWQAIKYAAYVSSLTKTQIVEVYQQYLDRYCGGGNATEKVCDFLDVDDLEEVVLNNGNSQRIVMIAAHFRKEVTATALWLLRHGISTQCFKITPYMFGSELLIDVRQIIPVPEAEEFMIGLSSKDTEEKAVQGTLRTRHHLRLAFWEQTLEAFRQAGITLYQNVSPTRDHWLSAGSGLAGCPYSLIFGKSEARVELSLQRADADENKQLFDALYARREEIHQTFGAELNWRRLDEKKSSRIEFSQSFDGYNKDNWPSMIVWLTDHIRLIEAAFKMPLAAVRGVLKEHAR